MKDEAESLVENIKIYSDGLILAIERGSINEGLDYLKKMTDHLSEVKQYLDVKKAIPKN